MSARPRHIWRCPRCPWTYTETPSGRLVEAPLHPCPSPTSTRRKPATIKEELPQ